MENKKPKENNDKLNSEKDDITEPKSLSEFLFKLFIVMILSGLFAYFYIKIIPFIFGDKAFVLSIIGFSLFFFIKYLISKISEFLKK